MMTMMILIVMVKVVKKEVVSASESEFSDSDFDENWNWTDILPEETVNPSKEGTSEVCVVGSTEGLHHQKIQLQQL